MVYSKCEGKTTQLVCCSFAKQSAEGIIYIYFLCQKPTCGTKSHTVRTHILSAIFQVDCTYYDKYPVFSGAIIVTLTCTKPRNPGVSTIIQQSQKNTVIP